MRKIELKPYSVKGRQLDDETGEVKVVDVPYDVKVSLVSVLFHPDLQLKAHELLERDKLANKINDCKDGSILLEEAEYSKLTQAIEVVKGFTKNDVEFVRRILEAEQVSVKEKK